MNPEIKDQWVRALREETWPQGFGQLYRPARDYLPENDSGECWCALGVLAELAIQNGVIRPLPPEEDSWYRERFGEPEPHAYLPGDVAEWAEIDPSEQHEIVVINDRGGFDYTVRPPTRTKTFNEVADWIEANL